MNTAIAEQIAAELKQIERDIVSQKKIIKNSVANVPVLETAEMELKALRTRQAVLQGNLKKLQTSEPA
jgi:hypothetical protein